MIKHLLAPWILDSCEATAPEESAIEAALLALALCVGMLTRSVSWCCHKLGIQGKGSSMVEVLSIQKAKPGLMGRQSSLCFFYDSIANSLWRKSQTYFDRLLHYPGCELGKESVLASQFVYACMWTCEHGCLCAHVQFFILVAWEVNVSRYWESKLVSKLVENCEWEGKCSRKIKRGEDGLTIVACESQLFSNFLFVFTEVEQVCAILSS